ncbi:restriction endonuclease subunit S [Streptomyces erythrochromogenes]|uniref:restriction endonuclease subunit S n=1 Tax=Streptomyces erythrochromogenes TaxID=285574 RepID=UPI00386FABB8|nr:restriction endonuclease subunit S [Streptomyces erythrochromogenes]
MLNRGSAPDYVDVGPVRVISQASNQASGLDWSRTRFHDFNGNPENLKGHLFPNDVLINSTGTGTLGRVGYFSNPTDSFPCMTDSHVTIARPKPNELYARFLYYWLSSQPFQEYVYAALVVGATNQIELNRDRLGDAQVPLPPLEEQRRIADFLDAETSTIDSYVKLHERLISVLQEKTSAAIESLLLHGHAQPLKAGRPDAAPFPSRFPIGRLKHVASRVDVGIAEAATHAYASDGVPLIRSTNIRANHLETRDMLYIAPWFAERNRSKYVFGGDIVTVRTGNAGVSAVVPQDLNQSQTFTQLITTLRAGNSAEYFCHFLNSRVCRQYFEIVSWGSAQKNISVPLLANAPVPIPPTEIQREVSESIEHLSEVSSSMVSKVDKARQLAIERRQALITAAVTGQFDVTTASGRNVTDGVTA